MGKLVDRLWKFATEDEGPPVLEKANLIVNWTRCAYHKDFLKWLRDEADKPINPKSSHADLIVSNARANTLKEVRAHLMDIEERAHTALESENG